MREIVTRIKDTKSSIRDLVRITLTERKLFKILSDFYGVLKDKILLKNEKIFIKPKSHIEIFCGTTIKCIFKSIFNEFSHDHQVIGEYTDEDIKKIIQKYNGDALSGFAPSDAFSYLIDDAVKKLRIPISRCLSDLHNHLLFLADSLILNVLSEYPKLSAEIHAIISNLLLKDREKSSNLIEKIICAKEGYIYSNDFKFNSKKISINLNSNYLNSYYLVPDEIVFINEIRNLVEEYFKVITINLRDLIPKIIGHFFISKFLNNLNLEFFENARHSNKLFNFYCQDFLNKKLCLENNIEKLENAKKKLVDLMDYTDKIDEGQEHHDLEQNKFKKQLLLSYD